MRNSEGGCRTATRVDLKLSDKTRGSNYLRAAKCVVKHNLQQISKRCRKDVSMEPLAAIKHSRNGSGGSAKLAQSLAAGNKLRFRTRKSRLALS